MSWLYNHIDQLDGYRLYAEIAHRFRPKVLPEDRDDIEQDIITKLKNEADKHTKVTVGFLWGCARNVVRTYWRKKYRERRRFCRLYEGDKGEMIADRWEFITPPPDIEAEMGARALLKTLPKRMIKVEALRAERQKLNNADKLYLYLQRHRLSKYDWTNSDELEKMRRLYVDEGLTCAEVDQIVGKARATVQRHLSRLGVIRKRIRS